MGSFVEGLMGSFANMVGVASVTLELCCPAVAFGLGVVFLDTFSFLGSGYPSERGVS